MDAGPARARWTLRGPLGPAGPSGGRWTLRGPLDPLVLRQMSASFSRMMSGARTPDPGPGPGRAQRSCLRRRGPVSVPPPISTLPLISFSFYLTEIILRPR